ncbi:MAG: hypothetical protein ACYC6Y_09075, partial [Thermoguttaceae bacterium]
MFKKIRHVTCRGEIHRLTSLREHPYAAFEYVLPDATEALLFVFGHGLRHNERVPNILLESFDPERTYDAEVYGERRCPRKADWTGNRTDFKEEVPGDDEANRLVRGQPGLPPW